MNVTGQITEFLKRKGSATPEDIAKSIPDLNQDGGTERILLLLRLNPQFEFTGSKWTIRGSGKSDEDFVREAAEYYFKSIGRPGAPIANVITEVSKSTGLASYKVKQILMEQFTIMNTNIFNRPKQQEDK